MLKKRDRIVVVDKNKKFSFLFQGFRKNKFSIEYAVSILKCAEIELSEISFFFIVVYEPRDIIQLIKIAPISKSIIIGTNNKRLFSSFKSINQYSVVDLSTKVNMFKDFYFCIEQFLE